MKVKRVKYYRRFAVIFGPKEDKKLLDTYPSARIVSIRPRQNLKPWGTREAVLEEEIKVVSKNKKQDPHNPFGENEVFFG